MVKSVLIGNVLMVQQQLNGHQQQHLEPLQLELPLLALLQQLSQPQLHTQPQHHIPQQH